MSETRLVYGFHAVAARLRQHPDRVVELHVDTARSDPRMRALLAQARAAGIRVHALDAQRLDRLLPGARHQGVAATVPAAMPVADLDAVLDAVDGPPLVLVLDGVTDPHNLGACLRSADAFGVHAVVAPKDRAVGLTPVVEKVASGATATVPYVMVTNLARTLDALKDRGVFVVGLAGEGDVALAQARLDGALALVLGAEGGGLRRL
ncbi:MAG: 23S rRNA (guanosine(2251)-2'-O)-methyltransferase RlmB, partial [Burkholderiales bacterium]|nr:23S rRNA (guanosine(2251)-2'-O)-methyltransferase RlmB [Burkholderiales bacterium]